MNLEPDSYAEIVGRLVGLLDLSGELVGAYDDPVLKKGAEEMHDSLRRILLLLKYQEIDSSSWPTTP